MFALRTGVSAPQALVLICVRNDLLHDSHMFALRTGVSVPQALVLICVIRFAITGLVGGGGVSRVCVTIAVV